MYKLFDQKITIVRYFDLILIEPLNMFNFQLNKGHSLHRCNQNDIVLKYFSITN
jgi:hypothetical protein